LKEEELLTAVVVLENFSNSFYPLDAVDPSCLLPLANKPLLSHTLEFLAASNVKRIYLYSSQCGEKVKNFLLSSKWASPSFTGIEVHIIQSEQLSCVGSVLRHMFESSLISHDFILVHGHVLSNTPLEPALEAHRARRAKDKDTPLVTVLMSEFQTESPVRMVNDDGYVVYDEETEQIFVYGKFKQGSKYAPVDVNKVLRKNDKVTISYEMVEAGVWICTPKVAEIFTDNFDYETADDFIKGVLSEEFLQHHIHRYLVDSSYCIKLTNFHLYHIIQQHILMRWLDPLFPELDNDLLFKICTNKDVVEDDSYQVHDNNVYIHPTTISKVQFLRNSIVGSHCEFNCGQITKTQIGKKCSFGHKCNVEGSTIMNNVKIGANCKITNSIIGNNVVIGDNVVINKGSIICDHVHISSDVTLPAASVIYLYKNKQQLKHSQQQQTKTVHHKEYAHTLLGENGRGYLWNGIYAGYEDEEDDEDDFEDSDSTCSFYSRGVTDVETDIDDLVNGIFGMQLKDLNMGTYHDHDGVEDDDDDEDEDDDDEDMFATNDYDDDNNIMETVVNTKANLKYFRKEVVETVDRGLNEGVQWDNCITEINGSRHANNVSVKDLIQTINKALLEHSKSDFDTKGGKKLFAFIKATLVKAKPLLKNYMEADSSQTHALELYESMALEHDYVLNVISTIVNTLYQEDLISEDMIIKWYENVSDDSIRAKLQVFMKWLQEADTETSEEESSSDEE